MCTSKKDVFDRLKKSLRKPTEKKLIVQQPFHIDVYLSSIYHNDHITDTLPREVPT